MLGVNSFSAVRTAIFDAETMPRLRILGRLLGGFVPSALASFILPAEYTPAVTLVVSWCLFYPLTSGFQPLLYSLNVRRAYLTIAMPVFAVLMAWMFALLFAGRARTEWAASVLPMLILGVVAIAPLYRSSKSKRTARRLAYHFSYAIAAVVVLIVEVTLLWNLV